MKTKSQWITRSLLVGLCLILVACGGSPSTPASSEQNPDPGEVATVVAATMEALEPVHTEVVRPGEVAREDSGTGQPFFPAVESTLVYTSDGSQCQRSGQPPVGGGGAGQVIFPRSNPGEAATLKLSFEGERWLTRALFSPDGGQLLGLGQLKARLWDTVAGAPLAEISLDGNESSFSDAGFSPDGQGIYIGTSYGEVQLWEPGNGARKRLAGWDGYGVSLAIHPGGQWIAAAFDPLDKYDDFWGNPSQILLLDTSSGETVQRFEGKLLEFHEANLWGTFTQGHFYSILAVNFSPNGQALLTAGEDAAIRLWDVASGEHLRCFESPQEDQHEVITNKFVWAEFSPDGHRVLGLLDYFTQSGEYGRYILVWEALSGQLELTIPFPAGIAYAGFQTASFSPDGQSILTAGQDNQVRVWDAYSGELVKSLWHPSGVSWAAYHPSGERVASAFLESSDPDSTGLWLWDINHPSLIIAAETSRRLSQTYNTLREGRIEDGLALIHEIAAVEPDPVTSAIYLLQACRYAAVWDWPAQALPTCQQAVTLADSLGETSLRLPAHESYAIALARTGDFSSAAIELETCLSLAPAVSVDLLGYNREDWLAKLREGQDPFEQGEIEAVRYGYLPPVNR